MTVRRAIFTLLVALTCLALPLQFAIDASQANLVAACIVTASSLVTLLYVASGERLREQPLSTFAILGFCFTTQLGALLVQTSAWTALGNSLYDPVYTFSTLAFYQMIAIVAHGIYRLFTTGRPTSGGMLRGALGWAGIYRVPGAGALWFMGAVGLVSFFFSRYEGPLGKASTPFNYLTWAPFLIPIYLSSEGAAYGNARRNRLLLGAYALAVGVLGVGLNMRGIMFAGVVTLVLLYLLIGLRSEAPVTRKPVVRLAVLACVLAAASGALSDLATSMAVAREWRGKIPPAEMIRRTFNIYQQPKLLAAYRAEREASSSFAAYDEHYISNALLARFIETKFHDNALHFARSLSSDSSRERLREVTVKFLWASLPTPLLHGLGVAVDKDDLNYSMGDYLAYMSRGLPLGGRKTGSMFAQGMVLFGPLFPFIYGASCLVLFGILDLLTVRAAAGAASISALGMLKIWTFFVSGLSHEALHNAFTFIIRDFVQMILVYALVLVLARWLLPARVAQAPPSGAMLPQQPI